MATTIGGKKIATTKSMHTCLTPPAMSNVPPMCPATPPGVPAPFPYFGRTQTASSTSSKLKIEGGGETLLKNKSLFKVDPPGNALSQPCPIHDVVTQQVNAKFSP